MLESLLLLGLAQTLRQVHVDLSNVRWLAPFGRQGQYVALTLARPYGPGPVHLIEGGKATLWFKSEAGANGATITHDGQWLVVSGWNGADVRRLDAGGLSFAQGAAGVIGGLPAAITWGSNDRTHLSLGGKRYAPPRGREWLMVAQQGDYVATYRTLRPNGPGESKYDHEIELWLFDAQHRIRRVRSLGTHWWDGGSTGVPSLLAVAGSGVAFVDSPAGGNALQFPVVIGMDGRPENPFHRIGWSMSMIEGVALAFDQGIICQIWGVDDLARREWEKGDQSSALLDYGHSWLAWMDGKSLRLWRTPSGFLNAWRASPTELGISVRNGKNIDLRTISLPPSNWWSPRR